MPNFDNSLVTFEWIMLLLRIAFIGLIYLFLYQIAQVALKELVHIGCTVGQQEQGNSSRSIAATVVVVEPADSSLNAGERIPIGTYLTVGRSSHNALVIDDDFTSSAHAEVLRDGSRWLVRDLSSTNGTYVNGRRVAGQASIRHGDEIAFGNVVVEFAV